MARARLQSHVKYKDSGSKGFFLGLNLEKQTGRTLPSPSPLQSGPLKMSQSDHHIVKHSWSESFEVVGNSIRGNCRNCVVPPAKALYRSWTDS